MTSLTATESIRQLDYYIKQWQNICNTATKRKKKVTNACNCQSTLLLLFLFLHFNGWFPCERRLAGFLPALVQNTGGISNTVNTVYNNLPTLLNKLYKHTIHNIQVTFTVSIIAFSALTLLVGQQEGHPACKKTEWWGAGVVVCLERGADLHTAQLMPLPLTGCAPLLQCLGRISLPPFVGW